MKRILLVVVFALIVLLVISEIMLRIIWGFGAPLLSVPDADIDYYFRPDQKCVRFGNRVVYNNKSMRMDYDIKDADRNCIDRIIVCGDSVINGGTLTDQKDVATNIVQSRYPTNVVQVLNVSAGSWGPGNILAYLKKFGGFDATGIIIEVDSHDLWEDDPRVSGGSIVGRDLAFPGEKPICAIHELLTRYVWPSIRSKLGLGTVNYKVDVPHWGSETDIEAQTYNLNCMAELYRLPVKHKALLIHRSRSESASGLLTYGEQRFREQAEEFGVAVYLLELDPDSDYRDIIHPNESGQCKMADLIDKIYRDMKDNEVSNAEAID